MIRGVTVKTRVPRWRAENPELEIVSLEIPAKKRQVVAIGYPKPDLSYTCHANNESNMVTSVLERLLYVEIDGKFVRPPKPTAVSERSTRMRLKALRTDLLPKRMRTSASS